MSDKIYVCYRRTDSPATSRAIYEALVKAFGQRNVFLDVDSVGPGADFRESVATAIAACAVFLLVIGPHWLDATSITGQRRVDDPSDLIRTEVELALTSGKIIVPVLVDGGMVPSRSDLPASMSQLASIQAVRFDAPDVSLRLIAIVRDALRSSPYEHRPTPTPRKHEPSTNPLMRIRAAFKAFSKPSLIFRPDVSGVSSPTRAPNFEKKLPLVFISHSHLDNIWCREFRNQIPIDEFAVWFDEIDMRIASTSFIRKLEKEILNCHVFVVILTANSVQSKWVDREFDLAMQENKIIVPVLTAPVEFHGFLKIYHQVNAIGLSPTKAAASVVTVMRSTLEELKEPELAAIG
jgi:TIR domain